MHFRRLWGDGLPAVEAPIGRPLDIAVDPTGAVLIADPLHTRVRKFPPMGSIASFVGGYGELHAGVSSPNGRQPFLGYLAGVAVDAQGTVIVADRTAHRVYAFAPDGALLRTLWEWPEVGRLNDPADVAVDDAGNLYVADAGNHRILKVSSDRYTAILFGYLASEPAAQPTSAEWEVPELLAYDPSNYRLWVVDRFGTRLSRLRASGELERQEELRVPVQGLAADSEGNLYLAVANQVLRRTAEGKLEIVAGRGTPGFSGDGGQAVDAELWGVGALAISGEELFIVDGANRRVRKVGSDGIIATVAGNGTAGRVGEEESFANASGWACADVVEAPEGTLYVSDSLNHRVAAIDASGRMRTVLGPGARTAVSASPETPSNVAEPVDPGPLALAADGALWVGDTAAGRLWWVTLDGRVGSVPPKTSESERETPGMFDDPVHLAVAGDGSVWVWDAGANVLYRFDPWSDELRRVSIPLAVGSASEAAEAAPAIPAQVVGLVSTSDGDIVVSLEYDSGERLALLFSPDGQGLASAARVPERRYRCAESGRAILRVGGREE